jgi:FkbM family methyltransferase
MFQEALDFTTRSIELLSAVQRWQPICAAVGDSDRIVEVRFDNPLEGTSRFDSAVGERSRKIRIQPLDAILGTMGPRTIGLLKLDIERTAGQALKGAKATLERCDYVSVETHSDVETATSSIALIAAGFHMFHCRGRTMWWRKRQD